MGCYPTWFNSPPQLLSLDHLQQVNTMAGKPVAAYDQGIAVYFTKLPTSEQRDEMTGLRAGMINGMEREPCALQTAQQTSQVAITI